MLGKRLGRRHAVRLFGAISVAASVAALAVPAASAARTAPSFYDNGVTIHDAYAAEVAQAVQESGFAEPAAPSGGGLPAGLGDVALGAVFGAALMAGVFRAAARGTRPAWRRDPSAGRSAAASSPAP